MNIIYTGYASCMMMFSLFIFATTPIEAHPSSVENSRSSIEFIENKGQWNPDAKFKANIPGGAVFITENGFVYNFNNQKDIDEVSDLICNSNQTNIDLQNIKINHHAYKMSFKNTNASSTYIHDDKKSYYHNYFLGNDTSMWAGNVPVYGEVTQKDLYQGIDLTIYGNINSFMKYDLIVSPGTDPKSISFYFEGVDPILTTEGNLLIKTSVNEIIEKAPFTYQEIEGTIVEIESNYVINDKNELSFEFPKGFNSGFPLIIDPEIVFATYSGAVNAAALSYTTTYDKDGALYTGTNSRGTGWPVTLGAFQQTFAGGGHDIGINKYSSDGSNLIYSTYYGGSSTDYPNAIIVNDQNELILIGNTLSDDLAVTPGCYNSVHYGLRTIFVAHFNSLGTDLIGATYIGSTSAEPHFFKLTETASTELIAYNTTSPLEVNYDDQGNIWVVANTPSRTFPTTANAFQPYNNGDLDGIIFQLNPTCTDLLYSSYIGGSGNDGIFAIQFNSKGEIVICGATQSMDFPTTSGVLHHNAPGGNMDGFVSIINPVTGALISSTYIGTDSIDQAVNIQIDCDDNIYVLGRTLGDYPISPGTYNFPDGDIFIDILSPNLNSSILSTRSGIDIDIPFRYFPTSFLLDACGKVYLTGLGAHVSNLPQTPDSFDFLNRGKDFWFAVYEPNFAGLYYSSYYGSGNDHTHTGVNRMDQRGIMYHSVCTSSGQWPISPNAFARTKTNDGQDVVSFKIDFMAQPIDVNGISGGGRKEPHTHAVRGCKSAFLEYTRDIDSIIMNIPFELSGTAQEGIDYELLNVNNNSIEFPRYQTSTRIEIKPLLAQQPSGIKHLIITTFSPCVCPGKVNDQVISSDTIWIYDSLYAEIITPLNTVCPQTSVSITAETAPGMSFEWSTLDFIPDDSRLTITPSPDTTATYTIKVFQDGAPATCPFTTVTYKVFVEPYPEIYIPERYINTCPGDSLDLIVYAEPIELQFLGKWTPSEYLRNDYQLHNKFFAPVGEYKKTIEVFSPVAKCSTLDSLTIKVNPPIQLGDVYPKDTTVDYGDFIQLYAEGNAESWHWYPANFLSDPNIQFPVSRPFESITYIVTGTDKYGCIDTAHININVVYESNVFLPNAFSPNNDGLNDVFSIQNIKYDELKDFKIFNRYGQMVFSTTDPEIGWDGTINNKPALPGVYFYYVKLILPDKTEEIIKGDVSLIR